MGAWITPAGIDITPPVERLLSCRFRALTDVMQESIAVQTAMETHRAESEVLFWIKKFDLTVLFFHDEWVFKCTGDFKLFRDLLKQLPKTDKKKKT